VDFYLTVIAWAVHSQPRNEKFSLGENMDKILKILVVLILIMSIAAVVMELKLYGQREELKGRTVKLAEYVGKIAATIEIPQTNADLVVADAPHMKLKPEAIKQYYKIGDDGKPSKVTTGAGTMDDALLEVLVNAGRQFDRLNDTRTGLTENRNTLGTTSNLLVRTEGTLGTTSNSLVKAEGDLAVVKTDLEKKVTQITDLTAEVETGKADIEKKANEIAKLGEKLSESESKIEAGKRYIAKVERELKSCLGQSDTNALPRGVQGQISVVNTNWNFVVMEILPDSGIVPLSDITVQRADQFVGKVRISEVRRDLRIALGEILMEYQQKVPVRGDTVFY
jgi:hypothetical protein